MIVRDWRETFGTHETAYSLLRRLPAGLMLDVGAAVGMTTSWMLESAPEGQVLAFEPFDGNVPHFERVHGDDARVELVRAAVSDTVGTERFGVRAVIEATTECWAQYAGGSSLGRFKSDGALEVRTVTLDSVLAGRPATFLKIDVQGAEAQVIRGASKALGQQAIDMLFVEYNHLPEVLSLLEEFGYECFDHEYLVKPHDGNEPTGWDVHDRTLNSMGRLVLKAFPKKRPSEGAAWCAFMAESEAAIGSVSTDLVFMTPDVWRQLEAVA